jgi:effector protein SdbA
MCLGGAIATLAAGKLHAQGHKVKLYNERSFSSFINLLTGFVLPDREYNYWNPWLYVRFLTAGLIYVLCVPILWLSGWTIHAAGAWDKIPPEDKNYSVIRGPELPNSSQTPEYDGFVNDSWSSMAAHINHVQMTLQYQKQSGATLSEDESKILADHPEKHHFRVQDSVDLRGRKPHHVPRRQIISSTPHPHGTQSGHEHMIESFKKLFSNKSFNNSFCDELCARTNLQF